MAEHNASKMDKQHWATVRELWMQKDKEQCESWKDEVQNILIFSGLFSAIVTAFLIDSQKALRPDPAQESVQLLRQIAAQSAGQNWVTGGEPSIISVCVNIFWFLSLVLSLTAALIGIVSLQWVRTHMSTLGDGPESIGFSHMHSLGLQKSYIPLIFASLPVILILGLTFFLVGLIVFLFELSWPVAIPATIAIGFTFVFLLTTTLHPVLQSFHGARSNDNLHCFPSPYRSPQSLLVLRGRDWKSTSEIWLRQRQWNYAGRKGEPIHFAYDTIEALVSVRESRSAESEKERTAWAKCFAEVLPIHLLQLDPAATQNLADLRQRPPPADPIRLNLFATRDLADLIPFLPPSEFVPSALFTRENSATQADLGAAALVQLATCIRRPSQTSALVMACVLTTRWLFERPRTFDSIPDNQPLHLISKPDELSLEVLEVLIGTLTRFFSFAVDFHPGSKGINRTTHTSSYTYWFLVLSANILTKRSLSEKMSEEMKARHDYLLDVIATPLGEDKASDYLFFTASIYASIISRSSALCSSPFGGKFLSAVTRHHDRLKGDLDRQRSQLRGAVKANEVAWGDIDHALGRLGRPSDPK